MGRRAPGFQAVVPARGNTLATAGGGGGDSARAPLTAWDEATFRALLVCAPPTTYRRGPGRETFPFTTPSGARAVVKRFRTGLAREGWRERLRLAPARYPAEREWSNLCALGALGLPVPAPIGWAADGSTSVVVLELVPHRESLRQLAGRDPAAAARAAAELAALVARLHGAGWCHRDLYLEHVAVAAPAGRLVLLDLGRARHTVDRRGGGLRWRWMVKDLAALAHSSRDVPGETRRAFLDRYAEARGIGGVARRRLARAALAKAERMARHVPRHVDPGSQEGGVS